MKYWFTADTHFGHKNIAGPNGKWKEGYRTFQSVEEMDEELLNQINRNIPYNSIIYHLGDFAFGKISKYRKRIYCDNINLILGNHDPSITSPSLRDSTFMSVKDADYVFLGGKSFYLHHYACRVWNQSHRGAIHLYGHSHASLDDNWGKSMDVGVDNAYRIFGEYRPFSLEEIIEIMDKRDIYYPDHHGERTQD